jgi:hypothetical protein
MVDFTCQNSRPLSALIARLSVRRTLEASSRLVGLRRERCRTVNLTSPSSDETSLLSAHSVAPLCRPARGAGFFVAGK